MAKRRNSPLFSIGSTRVVDVETGESVPVEGGGFRMLPGPPGTCQWCHVQHEPGAPHDRDSLPYQMKFHQLHGRWPTWSDAMAHCDDATRAAAREALVSVMTEHGLEVPDDLR